MEKANLLIRASAGTGKTYSLATRCLWLLLVQHVSPETIVALTFSRAAAQEIYAAVLKRLWVAAGSDEEAKKEAKRLLAPALTPEDFMKALRALINSQHVGNIATIDSFILKLVCNYPLELGFQNAVAVIDDFEKREGLESASGKYLESEDRGGDNDLQAFISAFKACMKKAWPREIRSTLSALMGGDLRGYVAGRKPDELPSEAEMLEALQLTDVQSFDVQPPATAAVSFTCKPEDGKVFEAFDDFVSRLRSFTGEEILGQEKKAKSGQAIKGFWAFFRGESGGPAMSYVKKAKGEEVSVSIEIPVDVDSAIRADIARADKLFLIEQVKKAAHQLTVLKAIEKNYDREMRRAGRLTFTDLAEFHKDIPFDKQLNIEYRFDSKFNHWALDEFQDTSCAQWGCLSALVDNAAQDDEKSVMTVGDLKQAIYGWRGGSKEPFSDVAKWCDQGAEKWADEDLHLSYRYQKNICEFVNRIFNKKYLASQDLFLGTDAEEPSPDWLIDDFWKDHEAETRSDFVKVVGVDPNAPREEVEGLSPEASEVTRLLAKPILDQIDDCWHNKRKSNESLGVLVRDGKQGLAIASVLRQKGLPVVWEGKRGIRDTPIVELFLSPLVLAEHPEDAVAWGLLKRSSPAGSLPREWTSAERVSRMVSESLAKEGLARTLQKHLEIFSAYREELAAVIREAVKYENQGKGANGIDAFKKYLDGIQNCDVSSGSNQIRIMTIHHSKGLTLDHVFVPLFESSRASLLKMCNPPRTVLLSGSCGNRHWVLSNVTEKMSCCHEALRKAWRQKNNEYVSEVLNLHYVALTRARRSLTVILPTGVQGVSSLIVGAIESDARWQSEKIYELTATEEPKKRDEEKPVVDVQSFCPRDASGAEDFRRVSPSRAFHLQDDGLAVPSLPTRGSPFAADFGLGALKGTEKHAELAKIAWLEAKEDASDFDKALSKPTKDAVVWREKPYEICLGQEWESGCFDRVVFYEKDGVRKAVISDFKVTKVADDKWLRQHYWFQLQSYRRAIHLMMEIDYANIAAQLLVQTTDDQNKRVIKMIPFGHPKAQYECSEIHE